ncbi:MAG: cysteine hydrolase [Coriobacteriia bacterium]|nr:cysteine hydrolase [Coriobacteriia bacterium]MCL2745831.1 cysteine hydrolase [Coriobacteriia bacterium]MCL2870549.1 cysteine hydrolase [Coriobacteriia bacterium]
MAATKWNIERGRCALLVIDMQNDFVREGAIMEVPEARNQLPRIATLIETCRALDIPIIYTVHQTDPVFNPLEIATFPHLIDGGMRLGTDGIEVVNELEPAENDYVLRKRRYSAFYQTDLEIVLRNTSGASEDDVCSALPVDTLIICGTVSNICCESTARDAYYRDYKVIFGSDVCSALNKAAHDATLANMELFGQVMTSSEVITALRSE